MGLTEWLALLTGVLKFPGEILALIKILQTTPQANHEILIQQMTAEALKYQQTGRPTW